jgi:hypothetical protein
MRWNPGGYSGSFLGLDKNFRTTLNGQAIRLDTIVVTAKTYRIHAYVLVIESEI